MIAATIITKGSPSSGNYGHSGRPGQVGGSVPKSTMSQAETDIRTMVDQFANYGSKRSELAYNNYYDIVRKKGKFFSERIPLPKGCKKGKPKQCYLNSFNNMSSGDYLYTEGLVFLESIPIPIEHAWLTTKDGKVIDTTLPAGDKAYYYGVQMNPEFVLERAFEIHYPGVLSNDYMAKKSIIEHGFPEGALYEEIVTKGSSSSGNFGHAGRPGKVGGSSSSLLGPGSDFYKKTHSGNDYGPFGENELLYENAYHEIMGQNVYSPIQMIGATKRYNQLTKNIEAGRDYKPDADGLIYIGTDPANDVYTQDVRYESPEWKKVWGDKDAGVRYITSDQLNYVVDKLKVAADDRQDFIAGEIPLPPTYQEFFGDFDPTAVHAYDVKYGTPEYDKFVTIADGYINQLKQTDMTMFGKGEVEYNIFDGYEKQVVDEFGEDSEQAKNVSNWLNRVGDEAGDYHEFEVLKAVCAGDVTPEYADKTLGEYHARSPHGDARYEELPTELWHAATDSDSIEASGIKSRRELGGRVSEVGLGGGEEDTISFTTDPKIGSDIERSLHEAHMVATGKLTVKRMLEVARDGAGGVGRNWAADLVEMKEPSFFKQHPEIDKANYDPFKDGMPGRLRELIDMEEGKRPVTENVHGMGDRGETLSTTLLNEYAREKILDHAFEYFKYDYSTVRQSKGGFMDPLFFGTNWKQLAKRDPKKFKLLKYMPKTRKSRGYKVSSLGEWRIVGGDNVALVEVVDNYDATDTARILGYTQ